MLDILFFSISAVVGIFVGGTIAAYGIQRKIEMLQAMNDDLRKQLTDLLTKR